MQGHSSWALIAVLIYWPSQFAIQFIRATGELRQLNDVMAHTGRCERQASEHHGFEDFAAFEDGALVAIASDHSHFAFKFGVSMRDALSRHNGTRIVHARVLRKGKWRPLKLQGAPSDFAPHGLAGTGKIGANGMLLIVNHRTTHDTIEMFTMRSASVAEHAGTWSHPLLFNVNDCAFTSTASFICTNWRQYETGTLADAVELYAQRPWSYVVECTKTNQGLDCVVMARGLPMANGIAVRGELVFVVASLEPSVRVYKRSPRGGLELQYSMATRAACDNLMWHGESLLTACHPRALTFVKYSKRPREELVSPCEVLRFDDVMNASRSQHGSTAVYPYSIATQVYVDSVGDEFSACAVAALDPKGTLWLGSVHDWGMLRCKNR